MKAFGRVVIGVTACFVIGAVVGYRRWGRGRWCRVAGWAQVAVLNTLATLNVFNPSPDVSSSMNESATMLLLVTSGILVALSPVNNPGDIILGGAILLFYFRWLISPLSSSTDRHRTEFYDTYALVAALAGSTALRAAELPPRAAGLFPRGDPPAYFKLTM